MDQPKRAPSTEPLSARTIWVTGVCILTVTIAAVALLLWPLQLVATPPGGGKIEALKVALSIGAGAGAYATLALAARRQRHDEQVARITEFDASERRVTELYSRSIEQLGSESATVRIGALHALKRLGDNNPTQRQAIANVLCSYLRMPYEVPGVAIDDEDRRDLNSAGAQDGRNLVLNGIRDARDAQELQVRITAQELLTQSVCRTSDLDRSDRWEVDIDLSHATLVDFRLVDAFMKRVRFVGCNFLGDTDFGGTVFSGTADFSGSACTGALVATGCTFKEGAVFLGLRVRDLLSFSGSVFDRKCDLHEVYATEISLTEANFRDTLSIQQGETETIEAIEITCDKRVYFSMTRIGQLDAQRSLFKADLRLAPYQLDHQANFEDATIRGQLDISDRVAPQQVKL
ncbi:hypothetical protein [Amycolatopsis sp. GM8]|uniref:hypothetical protein n=1 Tax=Amycolatopsis sp. GM8 TaxID=2896530 RepID=UPI001F1CC5C9|nr:hypothetical protein [Amycolatopsis sp. GM8]